MHVAEIIMAVRNYHPLGECRDPGLFTGKIWGDRNFCGVFGVEWGRRTVFTVFGRPVVGEAQGWVFEPEFNRAVKVDATDARITSDAGLLLLREADHRLGLTEHLAGQLVDPRDPTKIRYELVELLRERVYAFALGSASQDDADRLAHDPAMKLAAWNRPGAA
jgi:Transposase DDE domain group 1